MARLGSANICITQLRDGFSSAVVTLYRESASSEKPLRLLYTFSSGELASGVDGKTLSECLNGWSQERSAATHYAISASVRSDGEIGEILPTSWLDSYLVAEKGETIVSVTLYQRAIESPTTPSSAITYNFYTGAVTGGLGAWSASIPEWGTAPLWSISAVASAVLSEGVESDEISASEWSSPKKVAENGESPVEIYFSTYSWLFPADSDGIVTAEEYAKFQVAVNAVKGNSPADFTMTASATGISDISVTDNIISASSSSRMTGDSASVEVSVTVNGASYTKTITLAKAKQSKSATLYFRWSKSETEFLPKDADSNFWIAGTSFIFFNTSLVGNIPISTTWLSNWEEIQSAKDEEYCYLWCKTSEDGTPFLFTGATGKTGACTLYQYYASTSSETLAGGAWVDDMPSISGGKYLWMRTKSVPAGGVAGDYAWGTPVLAGTDISALMASIEESNEQLVQNTASIVANSKAIEAKVEQTVYDEKVGVLETSISATEKKIALQVSESGDITDSAGTKLAGIAITKDGVEIDGATVIKNGSLTASQINATELFKGKEFEISSGGAIKSSNYEYGTSGFYLGDDGVLKAMGADLVNAKVSGKAEFTGKVITTALETVNEEGTTAKEYTQSLGTAYYQTQLINNEVAQIAENTADSETSATSFSMAYNGTTYTTPRKFTTHSEQAGGNVSLTTLSAPTISGAYVYVTATNTITTTGNRKFKFSQNKGNLYVNYHDNERTESQWIPTTYTYDWVIQSAKTLTGTAPEDTGFPSSPSVGTVHVSYDQLTENKYTATTYKYSKVVDTEGYWQDVTIEEKDGTTAMYLVETSITLDGTAVSFDTWISAGTVVITEKWRPSYSNASSYSSPYWDGNPSTYSYSYSYSRYYGLGVFFGSTSWQNVAAGMSYLDVSVTRDGTITLQAGSSYSAWTGATKYYKFFHSLEAGSWPVTGGTWNGSTVSGGTLTISTSSVSYGGATWNVGTYYTQTGYLPTFSLIVLSLPVGCYISGGLYPPEGSGTAELGTAQRKYSNLYVNNISCNGLTGNVTGNVNTAGTGNVVYGCKFTSTPLLSDTATSGKTYTIPNITQYEWITILAGTKYTRGVATFHKSLYSIWSGSDYRLVLSSDSEYLSVYFSSATSITIRDKSSSIAEIRIYGYK